jgi:PadR family transcriptional regulator, regulatory protein PadR
MATFEALGEFEQIVLLAIVHVGEGAYGVPVREEIERRTGREISVGALYTAFDRLERKGFVYSTISDPTPQRGGRARRFVTVSASGLNALRRSRELHDRMWAGISSARLKPVKGGPS